MAPPARAHHELTNTAPRIRHPIRILQGETLIVMPVTTEHDIRPSLVERHPEIPQARFTTAGTEHWFMEDRQGTRPRIRSQVSLQPLSLRGSGTAAANLGTIAVEDNDVPAANVIAVIPLAGITRCCTKVAEIAGSYRRRIVFIIADCGMGPGFMTTPGGFITVVIVSSRTIGIGIIPNGVHCAWDIIKQLSRLLIPIATTIRNIPRANEDRVGCLSQGCLRGAD